MRETHYYKLCFGMPIALPVCVVGAVIALGWLGVPGLDLHRANPVAWLAGLMLWSVILGGVQYALFAVVVLLYLRRRDARAHRRAVIAAPALFTPIAFASLVVLGRAKHVLATDVALPAMLVAAYVIPLECLYVGLCLVGHWALTRRGLLRSELVTAWTVRRSSANGPTDSSQ